jgi:hypothetical protein
MHLSSHLAHLVPSVWSSWQFSSYDILPGTELSVCIKGCPSCSRLLQLQTCGTDSWQKWITLRWILLWAKFALWYIHDNQRQDCWRSKRATNTLPSLTSCSLNVDSCTSSLLCRRKLICEICTRPAVCKCSVPYLGQVKKKTFSVYRVQGVEGAVRGLEGTYLADRCFMHVHVMAPGQRLYG